MNPNSTLSLDERAFAIDDTAIVNKIFISDMNGTHITYIRKQDGWQIEETQQAARRDVIDMMLRTLKNNSVRYPVSKSALQNAIKDIAAHNKKVEVYDDKNKKIRSIIIGPPAPDGKGNYMLVEKAETPYVVWNTNFVGSLDTRFSTDVNLVRSRLVLSISFPTLAEIVVQHSDSKLSSYSINVQKPDSFLIINLNNKQSLPNRQIDKDKVFEYIDFLKAVYCESIITSESEKMKAVSQEPFCVITFKLRNGTTQEMKCYYKEISKRSKSQTDAEGKVRPYDLDRFYGVLNGSDDIYLLQDFHFGKLLKTFEYFKK
jgi:hypothetical protein